MQFMNGKMVRLNVPEWYRDPEFQAWFNQRLGKGLATWQNAQAPLQPEGLSAKHCGRLAARLIADVINADVLFEPISCGASDEIEASYQRLKTVEKALESISETLERKADEGGLTPEEAADLADRLSLEVIAADALFEPTGCGTQDDIQSEYDRLKEAEKTLGELHEALKQAAASSCEDAYAYADCFVGVDPGLSGEGTDSDMPEKFWDVVVEAARQAVGVNPGNLHVMVWLSPVK